MEGQDVDIAGKPDAHSGIGMGFAYFFRAHASGNEFESVGINWTGYIRLKGRNQFRGFCAGGTDAAMLVKSSRYQRP